MTTGRKIGFFLSGLAAAIGLLFFAYSDSRVATLRLEHLLDQDKRWIEEEITRNCNVVTGTDDTQLERFFLEHFTPPAGSHQETRRCSLTLQSASANRFNLRSQWVFTLQISNELGQPFLTRSYSVSYPMPLVLLPLVLFLLSLVFGIRAWRFRWTCAAYLFLLGGANLIQTTRLCLRGSWLTLTTDQTFIGLTLVLLWLSMHKSTAEHKTSGKAARGPWEDRANRFLTTVLGLWSPSFYTTLGRLLFPIKGGLNRLLPFLDAQFFIACLSLYLFAFEFGHFRDLLERSILLPRYFTFTAVFFFLASYWTTRPRRQVVLWHIPNFVRALSFVVVIEGLSFFIPRMTEIRTLTRVGFALVLSELVSPVTLSLPTILRNFLPWLGVLFLASFLSNVTFESGLTELALGIWDPRAHPTGLVLFTFLAGLVLGFLSGSFSVTFFALFTLLMKTKGIPMVKAALLDGVLAGSLLSPFSIFNLLPAVQFRLNLGDLVAFRFRQMAYPLLIGTIIFTISALTSVSILQPVTFVFLVLLALAFQLKKRSWFIANHPFPSEPQPN